MHPNIRLQTTHKVVQYLHCMQRQLCYLWWLAEPSNHPKPTSQIAVESQNIGNRDLNNRETIEFAISLIAKP